MTEVEIQMDMKKRMVMEMASSTNLQLWPVHHDLLRYEFVLRHSCGERRRRSVERRSGRGSPSVGMRLELQRTVGFLLGER